PLADGHGARIALAGPTEPNVMRGLDPVLVGKDRLPWLKETSKIIAERSTNWTIVPCANENWARLVHAELPEEEAHEKLWGELEHVLRLDEADPEGAWEERMAVLNSSAERMTQHRFDAIELRGPGTELTIGMLPTHTWWAADFTTAEGLRHFPNLPTEEVFTTPDPVRTAGKVASTKPLVLRDGTIIRGLRVAFEDGVATKVEADENGEALRSQLTLDEQALRLGELALVDRQGRIGPLGTVFYDTLLDENAASHIAFGSGFPFLVDDEYAGCVNESGI